MIVNIAAEVDNIEATNTIRGCFKLDRMIGANLTKKST